MPRALAVPRATTTGLANGQELPYAGRVFTLTWHRGETSRGKAKLEGGEVHVWLPAEIPIGSEPPEALKLLLRWYAARALERVQQAVARWVPSMALTPANIFVRNQRSRWGSCATDGTLRFNWRLAMFDDSVVDYVVVHELAHLRVRNHSAAFWAEVAQALPGYDNARARLRAFEVPAWARA